MYLYHGAIAKVMRYKNRIYNTFGYCKIDLNVESGTQDGKVENKNYYLCSKKIYSNRFSTDCFSEFFTEKALRSSVGINDLDEFATEKATFAEMEKQNSYFFNDLNNLRKE